MAMTLRLTDEETAELQAQARSENRSMQAVAKDAVKEYVASRRHHEQVATSMAWTMAHYKKTMQDLADR